MKKAVAVFLSSIYVLAGTAQTKKALANSQSIGVFDSGTGGLTVLNAILSLDYFNNVTGEPKPDGKPDLIKNIFSTWQIRLICRMAITQRKIKQTY